MPSLDFPIERGFRDERVYPIESAERLQLVNDAARQRKETRWRAVLGNDTEIFLNEAKVLVQPHGDELIEKVMEQGLLYERERNGQRHRDAIARDENFADIDSGECNPSLSWCRLQRF